jgi:hypothetical protein
VGDKDQEVQAYLPGSIKPTIKHTFLMGTIPLCHINIIVY